MKIEFFESAEFELKESVEFYNDQSQGLGLEFALEVQKTIERIKKHPNAWQNIFKKFRRCRTNRFPFGVVYKIKNDVIYLVAVAHFSRKPFYWKNRKK